MLTLNQLVSLDFGVVMTNMIKSMINGTLTISYMKVNAIKMARVGLDDFSRTERHVRVGTETKVFRLLGGGKMMNPLEIVNASEAPATMISLEHKTDSLRKNLKQAKY